MKGRENPEETEGRSLSMWTVGRMKGRENPEETEGRSLSNRQNYFDGWHDREVLEWAMCDYNAKR